MSSKSLYKASSLIIFFIVLICEISGLKAQDSLHINLRNRDTSSFEIKTIDKLTFSASSELKVLLDNGSSNNFSIDNIQTLTFRKLLSAYIPYLESIEVSSGTLTPIFDSFTLNYVVSLPFGTETIPSVVPTLLNPVDSYEVADATDINGSESERTTTIIVTSADKTSSTTYSILFNVLPDNPDFSLNASPNAITLEPGARGNSIISYTPTNGFSSIVSLSFDVASIPPGISLTLGSTSLGNGESIELTIDVDGTVATTSSPIPIVISGEFEGQTRTVVIQLSLEAALKPDFTLLANPTSLIIEQGSSGSTNISYNPIDGFNDQISLSVDVNSLPTGISALLNRNDLDIGKEVTLVINVDAAAEPTTLPIDVVISGQFAGETKQTTVELTVQELLEPDFILEANPNALTLIQGASGISTISYNSIDGFEEGVNLSLDLTSVPSSVSASLSNNELTNGSTVTLAVDVSADADPTAEDLAIVVLGTFENKTRSVTIPITIEEMLNPDFALLANPETITISPGSSDISTIRYTSFDGFAEPVQLAVGSLPEGVSVVLSNSNLVRDEAVELTITVNDDFNDSNSTIPIVITGQYLDKVSAATVVLIIEDIPNPTFNIMATPSVLTIEPGFSASSTISYTTINGFNNSVSLSTDLSSLPKGISVSFDNPVIELQASSSLSIAVDSDFSNYGEYLLLIKGVSPTVEAVTEITISVIKPKTVLAPFNQFSPNGDGIDELWEIRNIDQFPDYEVFVFNRSGQEVYRSKGYQNDWDGSSGGTLLRPGTYYFVIQNDEGENIQTGSVNLLR